MICVQTARITRSLWLAMVAAVVVCACMVSGCNRSSSESVPPGMLLQTDGCRIYADSMVFDNGMTVRAVGDSLLQVRLDGITLRQMQIAAPADGALLFRSSSALIDAFVRMEASSSLEPPADGALWSIMLNPLNTSGNWEHLQARLTNGYPVPQEVADKTWPIVNDNPVWLAAAAETAKCSGNRRQLLALSGQFPRILSEDMRVCRNSATGLFYGIPRYMAEYDGFFPSWMQPSHIFGCQTFGVNMAYVGALRAADDINRALVRRNSKPAIELAVDPDTLAHAVFRQMWLPQCGRFSAVAYGFPVMPVALDASDNFAQAFAVACGAVGGRMAATIVASHRDGQPLIYPAPGGKFVEPSAALRLARIAWCVAAAGVGDDKAFDDVFAQVLKQIGLELLSGRREWIAMKPLTAIALRAIAGARFGWDGVKFMPSIPAWLSAGVEFRFRWRKADIAVAVTGCGREIATCSVNGASVPPAIDSSASGSIGMEIAMAASTNGGAARSSVKADESEYLPEEPVVEWVAPLKASVAPSPVSRTDEDGGFRVWVNGVVTSEASQRQVDVPEPEGFANIQVASVSAQGVAGFSAVPHEYVPHGAMSVVHLASVAKGGTKVIQDRALAARFVESSRTLNRNLRFNMVAPADGRYIIDLHYISGLGIVNSRRGTALRICVVNGEREGVFVCPQLSPSSWDKSLGDNWQRLTSYSNPLVVPLKKGDNVVELRYFQTTPVYLDPTANTLVADFVRLILKNPS